MQLSDLLNKITSDLAIGATEDIAEDTELLMSGVIDSLGIMNLVGWLEQQLGVEIDPGDVVIENFETAAAIMSFTSGLS